MYTHTSYPPLTIRGGTGVYAGASGNSTLDHSFRQTAPGRAAGTDTWVGTLSVPGLEFDVSRPILEGIVSDGSGSAWRQARARHLHRHRA